MKLHLNGCFSLMKQLSISPRAPPLSI